MKHRKGVIACMKNGGSMPAGATGFVPGTGSGDKIPAKYEPGEFVVSRDMLALDPKLGAHLTSLRERALAMQGVTPEQADAKSIQADVAKTGAQVYAQLTSSAYSMIHASAGVSASGGTSVPYTYSGDTTGPDTGMAFI